MPMTRSGLSSLMGYQEGGGVDLADIPDANVQSESQSNNQPSSQSGLASMLQMYADVAVPNLQDRTTEYKEALSPLSQTPQRPSFYDLAGEISKGLFAQQSEKFPSIGRGVTLGFNSFSDKEKAKRKSYEKEAKDLASKATELALGDVMKGRDNFTKLLGDQIIKAYSPEIGTSVELVKINEDGTKEYKTLGNKQIAELNQANAEGFNKVTSGGLTVNTGDSGGSGLDKYFEEAGKNLGKADADYNQDLKLANDSEMLLALYRQKVDGLTDDAFGIVPKNTAALRNIMTSIPMLEGLVNKSALGTLESINNLTINLAMMSVQKTKGPISDTEMRLFIGGIPNMAQTREGVYQTLDLMNTLNQHIIKFSSARAGKKDEIIKEALVNGDNASAVSDRLTQWENEWRADPTNSVFNAQQTAILEQNYAASQADPRLKAMGDDAFNKIKNNEVGSIINPPSKKSSQDKSVDDMTPEELTAFIAENM
jgi:hypothetical protein